MSFTLNNLLHVVAAVGKPASLLHEGVFISFSSASAFLEPWAQPMVFGLQNGALFVFIFQKGHLAFSESVLVQIPTVPEKTVSRSFVFRLKLRSEKPRKRPIGCAFTRIRSKLTFIDGAEDGT